MSISNKPCDSLCGADCTECPSRRSCPGCAATNGCPYGRQCYFAKYILTGGRDAYLEFKTGIIREINALSIPGMEEVREMYPMVGRFVNLEYPLPGGGTVRFLDDNEMYLGAQVRNLFDDSGKTCFGIIARESFLLICEYGEGCTSPEVLLYKRR